VLFFIWAGSVGLVYTLVQGVYGVVKYYFSPNKEKAYLNHCKGVALSIVGYAIFTIGTSNGLVISV